MTVLTLAEFKSGFPELEEVKKLERLAKDFGKVNIEGYISHNEIEFPIYTFAFGNTNPNAPTLILTGGVHGLERIGTNIVLAYLRTVLELLAWDRTFQETLSHCRLLFYPIVNPMGFYNKTRCNANGVDLMRNAPVDSKASSVFNLASGQRISPKLPWYRGKKGEPMEKEAQLLCDYIHREAFGASRLMSIDVHSGFGMRDRLWFPYAKDRSVFPHSGEVMGLKKLLMQTYPNHIYKIEPQSRHYTAHGDLWDHLFLEHQQQYDNHLFIPFCLELGSWLWVKKNPTQLFSILGHYNPLVFHRVKRTLRRHLLLFDFFIRALISPQAWSGAQSSETHRFLDLAVKKWYPN